MRIPQGLVDLIASVSLVGIAELTGPLPPSESVQSDERWLQVQLLGEIDRGTNKCRRGVGTYPGLDDPVHFATAAELASVFPQPDDEHVRIGRLAAAEEVPVCIDATKFVVRHAAIVGSTGAGKTSAVASILQNLVRGGWQAAQVVVGEYCRALETYASIRSVLGSGEHQLRVPYWALPAAEISKAFTGGVGGGTFSSHFSERVMEARRAYAKTAKWLTLDEASITADTPVPFDIRPIWYELAYANRETRENKADATTVRVTDKGDAQSLRPPQFEPYKPGGAKPDKGPLFESYGNMPDLLRLGLLDPRLRSLQEPKAEAYDNDPLIAVMQEWLGGDKPISVLDFSGVPGEAADLAIGVMLNLLFEVALRSERDGSGIGRPSPVLVVLEEAHRYLSASANALTRESGNRIAREGRKYGVGLLLISQRPKELPDTALAQCGTIVALRLSNSDDQGTIRAALPDTISGLAAVLPSLRTGEAIVSGEAVVLPSRTILDLPDPKPLAEDPSLSDAKWYATTAANHNYRPEPLLLDEDAEADEIIDKIEVGHELSQTGGTLLITFNGHGGQMPPQAPNAQTWCAWDRQIQDKELLAILAKINPNVRVIIVSDSCYSGGMLAEGLPLAWISAEFRAPLLAIPKEVQERLWKRDQHMYMRIFNKAQQELERHPLTGSLVLIAAAGPNDRAYHSGANGLSVFTGAVSKTLTRDHTLQQFFDAAFAETQKDQPLQTPVLRIVGPTTVSNDPVFPPPI